MQKTYSILFLLLTFFSLECIHNEPDDLITKFGSYFVSTEQIPSNSLKNKLSAKNIDSVVSLIRINSAVGYHVDTLLDTASIPYLIGYNTPKRIRQDTIYPLVIYLHGGTGTDLNTKGEHAFEMLSALQDSMELFLVSPSANRNARWWSPAGLSRILQTLRFMTLHYPIDTTKVFLSGVSDGATGCWAAANTITGPFAGFFAISGYAGILPSTGMELFPQNIMQRPIYNINAGNDRLYPLDMITSFLDYMTKNGVQLISKIYPEEQHGFDYRDKEYGNICSFIRSWKKPSFKGFRWNFVNGFPNLPGSFFLHEIDSASQVHIRGFFDANTLCIQSNNVASIVLPVHPDQKHLFISENNKKPRSYSHSGLSLSSSLQITKEMGFPSPRPCSFIKIKLRGEK